MARTGRPPVADPRAHIIRYRVTAVELAALTAVASRCGQSVTDYVREMALIAAANGRLPSSVALMANIMHNNGSVKVP